MGCLYWIWQNRWRLYVAVLPSVKHIARMYSLMRAVFAEHSVFLLCETTLQNERAVSVRAVCCYVLLVSSSLLQPGFFMGRLKH